MLNFSSTVRKPKQAAKICFTVPALFARFSSHFWPEILAVGKNLAHYKNWRNFSNYSERKDHFSGFRSI
jgi:hypothetical protein